MAQTHAALVEELNAPDWWAAFFHGGGRLDEYRDTAPVRAAQAITDLTDELTQARAEIARYREALEVAQGDLHMMKKAIEAHDPLCELFIRATDIEKDLRAALKDTQ